MDFDVLLFSPEYPGVFQRIHAFFPSAAKPYALDLHTHSMSQQLEARQALATGSMGPATPALMLCMRDSPAQAERPTQEAQELLYSPVQLPPLAWQGRSPVLPQPPPSRRLRPGWEERVPDLSRRIEKLEQSAEAILKACGQRALNNATLPGLTPVTNPGSPVERQDAARAAVFYNQRG